MSLDCSEDKYGFIVWAGVDKLGIRFNLSLKIELVCCVCSHYAQPVRRRIGELERCVFVCVEFALVPDRTHQAQTINVSHINR